MSLNLVVSHIEVKDAVKFLQDKGCSVGPLSDEYNYFAICVTDHVADNAGGYTHGVIVMSTHKGKCALVHLYTNGTALVGSILYGAAWRAAKALGYKQITI